MSITMHTDLGDIKIELYCEQAPKSCENFLALSASSYYDNCLFHRNIKGFMVQTGDPSGTGKGGKSIWNRKYEDEISESLKHNSRGVVSMANSGPNTNGSQFFITYAKQPHLDMKYTIIGRVIDGLEVLDDLEKLPVEEKTYRPMTDVRIQRVTIHANPIADTATRPEKVCLCRWLPQSGMQLHRSRLIILQHPDELYRPMRTASLLEACLAEGSCVIHRARRFSHHEYKQLHSIVANEESVLLYPGHDSISLSSYRSSMHNPAFCNFILIDGTWKQAKEMYKQNKFLHQLKKVSVGSASGSMYVIRRQPTAGCLSTLESGAIALSYWECNDELLRASLATLNAMCEIQLEHGDSIHQAKN